MQLLNSSVHPWESLGSVKVVGSVLSSWKQTFPTARLGMLSPGPGTITNRSSTDNVPCEAVDSTGEKYTHQGLKVLAVVAGIGCGEGPQYRVALVALQGRGEEAAAEVGSQHVTARRLPDGRPACGLHPRSRRVAGDAPGEG